MLKPSGSSYTNNDGFVFLGLPWYAEKAPDSDRSLALDGHAILLCRVPFRRFILRSLYL